MILSESSGAAEASISRFSSGGICIFECVGRQIILTLKREFSIGSLFNARILAGPPQ